jgi:phosphatidylglycerophosphatase C
VVAFDLDGTLTRRDTMAPFLSAVRGRSAVVRTAGLQWYTLLRGATSAAYRDPAKVAFVGSLLRGLRSEELRETGQRFAAQAVASRLQPWARERIDWHHERGHELVMISASLEVYVAPMAELLGFSTAYATRLEVVDGRVTGRLDGLNVRGAEKARLLQHHLAGRPARVWAYGNSRGDLEMLGAADVPVFVRRRPPPPAAD